MLTLQIISALLLLLNKYYVRKKKTIGWSLGIWGTVSITIYFYLQMVLQNKGNLWIMIVYDIALICLMIYGYLLSSSKNNKLTNLLRKWNVVFKFVVSFVTIVVCVFLLIQAVSANLIVIQFLSAIGGLVGTLLLAFNTKSTNKIVWVVYFFTHLIVVYLMIETDSVFIAICQVFSAWVAVLGFRDELKKSI